MSVNTDLHKRWDHTRMVWLMHWIIFGLFVQAQGFSTTVVKEGEDAIIECGLQTTVEEGYLRWEAMTNDTTVVLAIHFRNGHTDCNDRIINCTIHANGSIQLESVSKEDGARYYRCLRGDDNGFNYFSDHRLLVLSKEKTSSPPSIETPHRESVISYHIGKKGVLHGYNAPVCEDDVDGNLPVVCYPPAGVIVDREYETIQCNCTDSDGLMDSVTFPVTIITHWVHPGWRKAFLSLLVITILISFVLILICCNMYKNLKRWKASAEEMKKRSETKDKQISDLKDKIAALEAKLNTSQTQLQEREREVSHLKEQLEQKEKQETEMKNKLEEQNEQINNMQTELKEREEEVSNLKDQLEQKEKQVCIKTLII
ncbi:uncharacterized protein [Apostichopus japonicus]|uniref:uncharacterized protein isoform X2 n=1 Tax=Stichopus japonicus TaxID=307972 RepID=UPI003AB4E1D7